MVYESHSTKSWLSSRRSEEVFYFTPRIREMVKRVKDVKSDILYSYGSRAIMDDSILINHLIFKLLEQEIEENMLAAVIELTKTDELINEDDDNLNK